MGTEQRPRRGQPTLERFIRDEIARRYKNISHFLRETGYPQASFYRVIGDLPKATVEQARHLESVLDLPRGLIDYIAEGEPEQMGEPFDRAMWEIYLRAMTDGQRARMVARLEEEFAHEFGSERRGSRNGHTM